MTKILVLSDDGVPSGYGRISMEVNMRLVKRGVEIIAASLPYDGLLPVNYEGERVPYHVASLAEHPDWPNRFLGVLSAYQPDIVMVIQDAPYAVTVRQLPIDWSKHGFIVITPVDGAPVYQPWIDMLKQADGTLSISQFGVNAHRAAGVESLLCRPSVDPNKMFRHTEQERAALRAKAGIDPNAFMLGTMAMNQGRKCIPHMLEGFFKFAADKPHSRYLLDMDAVSPAGWDIPNLCAMRGWDASKLLFRADVQRLGVIDLRERYNLLDAHAVLSHREGFGLPLVEAQACGVVSMALNYCSGPEICANDGGVLINALEYKSVSTWGNALDYHPDIAHFTERLQWLYDNPDERRAMAKRGELEARSHTWDDATDAVHQVIRKVEQKRAATPAPNTPLYAMPHLPPAQPDGIKMHDMQLVEG